MKKIICILYAIGIFFIMLDVNVCAKTSTNGIEYINGNENDNTFYLGCVYDGGYYITIDRGSTEDNGNIDTNTGLFNEAVTDDALKKYNFMNNEKSIDCPKYVVVDKKTSTVLDFTNDLEIDSSIAHYSLQKNNSSCTGKCSGNQSSNTNDYWTCNYTGPSGTLTTKYDGLYMAYYPDGRFSEVNSSDISPSCPDIFYNKSTHEMIMATYDYENYIKNNNNFDPKQHDYLCGNNKNNYEYYCSGSCKYPGNKNIDCERTTDRIEGITLDLGDMCSHDGTKSALQFIGYLLLIAKILVPVLLIVLGTVDFAKATISSDADALQKSTKSLINRIIAGVVIFLIPTVVNFVFKEILRADVFRYEECRVCVFEPRNCK